MLRVKNLQYIICIVILFLFTNQAWAGELYICTDQNGNDIISSVLKDGMKCKLKETFEEPTIEEQNRKEYIERKKITTEREKAITEQEKSKADQEREKARTLGTRRPDELCARECKMGRSSCESDCNRNIPVTIGHSGWYNGLEQNSARTDCYTNCSNSQKTCIDGCYY